MGKMFVPPPCVMHPRWFYCLAAMWKNQLAESHPSVEVRLWKVPGFDRRGCPKQERDPEIHTQRSTANPPLLGNPC